MSQIDILQMLFSGSPGKILLNSQFSFLGVDTNVEGMMPCCPSKCTEWKKKKKKFPPYRDAPNATLSHSLAVCTVHKITGIQK